MTAKEFYDAVCRMRTLQKDYFKYRQPEDLRKSRQAEKIIDEEIKRVTKVLANKDQLKIFGK